MADKADWRKQGKICSKCGKRITSAEQAGSLTSYLFQPFNCTCSEGRLTGGPQSGAQAAGQSATGDRAGRLTFCSDCGLQKVSGGAVGSITAFMFQDTRCKCPPKDRTVENDMAEKFWKLKQAEAGRTFDHSGGNKAKDVSDDSSINLLPGAIIGGVYSIIDLIGAGGMGEIYRANHLTLGKVVALKLIPPGRVTTSSWQRFQNEAKAIASLDHANLVKVTDLGIHEGCLPFLAMEYIDGRSLAEMLAREGRSPLDVVLDIFMQVCEGVDFAHRKGLVHRDLKPANIMLTRTESNKLQVKILDFGLVKLAQKDRDQQSLTRVGDVMGSPYYMSPEQCIGDKVDNRSDIYSIGCTMFESLTSRPPFVGPTAVEILTRQHSADPPTLASIVGAKVYPESLEVVIAKLLRKNPAERYQTLLELRGDLDKVARGQEVAPFYFSRTNPAAGDIRQNARAEAQDGFEVSSSSKQLVKRAMLAAISFVVILTAALASIPHQAQKQPTTKFDIRPLNPMLSVPAPGSITGSAPPSIKDSSPFSSIVREGGIKWRSFDFPKDCDLGQISDGYGQNMRAKDVVRLRLNLPLTFIPGEVAVKYPSYLKRFRPGDIYEVKISNANFLESKSEDDTLAALSNVPGVAKLNLSSGDEITNKSAAVIDKFTSLKQIVIGTSELDVDVIAKLHVLNQLELIRLWEHKDVSDVLKALRKSPSLKALDLGKATTNLDGLASISALPQLEEVVVGKIIPDNPETISQSCRILSKVKKLRVLTLGEQALSRKDVETISTMHSLEKLHFLRTNPASPEESANCLRLLARLPNLKTLSFSYLPLSGDCLALLRSKFARLQILTLEDKTHWSQLPQLIQAYPPLTLEGYSATAPKKTIDIIVRKGPPVPSLLYQSPGPVKVPEQE